MRHKTIFPFIFVVLALVIIGCQGLGGQTSKPTVIIASPPSGSVYTLGEEVVIQSTSTDPAGVLRVALLVDGNLVREDPSPVAQGQAQFSLIQSWIAEGVGSHTITVRSTNSQGASSDSGILVNIKEQSVVPQPPTVVAIATAVPLATATPQPTPIPQTDVPTANPPVTVVVTATPVPPTDVPPPTAAPTCVLNSKFVADVTIPDGTIFTPNAVFTKTWRVQNNGTCAWENFSIVFVSGTQMAASGIYPVPTTPPGGTADLVVPMTAPSNYGVYQGTWKMRSSAAQLFGTNLTVVINVPAPATAVPPTNTPPPTVAGCSGQPNDFTFNVSANNINAGQSVNLSWGAVTNASEVRLDGGEFSNEGVAAPGNRTVSPNATTQYTLTAKCNNSGQTRAKSVTVTVNAPIVSFAGNWFHNFGTMNLAQAGANVNGVYVNGFGGNGTLEGTVTGNQLNGTWEINGTDGSFQFTLSNNGKTFTGNFDGAQQWCGARNGQNFPNGCSFAGNWTSDFGDGDCPMSLTRKDLAITGTYCLGTVTGTVSYAGLFAIASGTYNNVAPSSGSFKFYLPAYSASQFSGNFNGANEWCGWRSSSSKPNPCLKP